MGGAGLEEEEYLEEDTFQEESPYQQVEASSRPKDLPEVRPHCNVHLDVNMCLPVLPLFLREGEQRDFVDFFPKFG